MPPKADRLPQSAASNPPSGQFTTEPGINRQPVQSGAPESRMTSNQLTAQPSNPPASGGSVASDAKPHSTQPYQQPSRLSPRNLPPTQSSPGRDDGYQAGTHGSFEEGGRRPDLAVEKHNAHAHSSQGNNSISSGRAAVYEASQSMDAHDSRQPSEFAPAEDFSADRRHEDAREENWPKEDSRTREGRDDQHLYQHADRGAGWEQDRQRWPEQAQSDPPRHQFGNDQASEGAKPRRGYYDTGGWGSEERRWQGRGADLAQDRGEVKPPRDSQPPPSADRWRDERPGWAEADRPKAGGMDYDYSHGRSYGSREVPAETRRHTFDYQHGQTADEDDHRRAPVRAPGYSRERESAHGYHGRGGHESAAESRHSHGHTEHGGGIAAQGKHHPMSSDRSEATAYGDHWSGDMSQQESTDHHGHGADGYDQYAAWQQYGYSGAEQGYGEYDQSAMQPYHDYHQMMPGYAAGSDQSYAVQQQLAALVPGVYHVPDFVNLQQISHFFFVLFFELYYFLVS